MTYDYSVSRGLNGPNAPLSISLFFALFVPFTPLLQEHHSQVPSSGEEGGPEGNASSRHDGNSVLRLRQWECDHRSAVSRSLKDSRDDDGVRQEGTGTCDDVRSIDLSFLVIATTTALSTPCSSPACFSSKNVWSWRRSSTAAFRSGSWVRDWTSFLICCVVCVVNRER